MRNHRLKNQGKCYKFGFQSGGDYGDSWDSVVYWHQLIDANGKGEKKIKHDNTTIDECFSYGCHIWGKQHAQSANSAESFDG